VVKTAAVVIRVRGFRWCDIFPWNPDAIPNHTLDRVWSHRRKI